MEHGKKKKGMKKATMKKKPMKKGKKKGLYGKKIRNNKTL